MLIPVEVAADEQIAGAVPRGVVEQQAAQDALLGLQGVRRDLQLSDFVVGAFFCFGDHD